jgi:hypothetical protein
MRIQSKYYSCLATTLFVVLGALSLATAVSTVFIVFAIFGAVAGGLYLMSLSCNRCGAPALLREETVFGYKWKTWWPHLPRRCALRRALARELAPR